MIQLIHPAAEAYSRVMTTALESVAAENEVDTLANHPHSKMHSGQVQGKLLEMISRMLQPQNILEIGTFTGFSALCLARGLREAGRLHTIELREKDAKTAADYFAKAGLKGVIQLHIGNALNVIPVIDEVWDLVFIDADKVNYINYYELTLPKLKAGGWIIADNVLFHGSVLAENITEKNAIAMHAFNNHVAQDNRVEQLLLTVRDGLMLIRKL